MKTALQRLDAIHQPEMFPAPPWVCPPFAPIWAGEILAFDQSLSATGWAWLKPIPPYLKAAGTVTTDPDLGHEGNLKRSIEIFDAVLHLIGGTEDLVIAHETPPVGDGMNRPESSLLAALSIRIAAHCADLPVHMVAAQRAKRRLTGRANADKNEVQAALKLFWPMLPLRRPWNAHIRDAAALGIVAYEEYSG